MRRLPTFKNKYECCNHLDFSSPHTQYVFLTLLISGIFLFIGALKEIKFCLSCQPVPLSTSRKMICVARLSGCK